MWYTRVGQESLSKPYLMSLASAHEHKTPVPHFASADVYYKLLGMPNPLRRKSKIVHVDEDDWGDTALKAMAVAPKRKKFLGRSVHLGQQMPLSKVSLKMSPLSQMSRMRKRRATMGLWLLMTLRLLHHRPLPRARLVRRDRHHRHHRPPPLGRPFPLHELRRLQRLHALHPLNMVPEI